MQQTFLSYGRYCWAKIALVSVIPLVASYLYFRQPTVPNGRTMAGFVYGVLGSLAILLLMYYGVRKRRYTRNQWSLQAWLSFHCYVGGLTLLLILLHAGFALHANIHTLAFVLLAVVVISGMAGAWLYLTMPRLFSQFGAELVYVGARTIDTEINQLRQQMQRLCQGKSKPFADRGRAELQRGLPSRPVGWRVLFRRLPLVTPLETRRQEFAEALKDIPLREHEAFQRLGALAEQTWEIERRLVSQMRLQNLLEAWLYVHLPISWAMLLAILFHIFVVFYHGYRVL